MSHIVAGVGSMTATDQEAPPPPHRRPRVREVSSRFMSPTPVVSSFSTSSDHLSIKSPLSKHAISTSSTPGPGEFQLARHHHHHRLKTNTATTTTTTTTVERRHLEKEGLLTCCAHENIPETIRSLDTPLVGVGSHNTRAFPAMRKQQQQRASSVKLFKENVGEGNRPVEQKQHSSDILQSSKLLLVGTRPETPAVSSSCFADRIVPSRFRTPTHSSLQHLPTHSREISVTSDAAKLLQSSGLSQSFYNHGITQNKGSGDHSSQEAAPLVLPAPVRHNFNGDTLLVSQSPEKVLSYDDSDLSSACIPIRGSPSTGALFPIKGNRTRSLPDTRSSVPEGNMLPTLSTRTFAAPETISSCSIRNVGNCQVSKLSSAYSCSRSLNMPLSSCESSSLVHSLKHGERPFPHLSKPSTSSSSMPSLSLPPHPTCMRSGVDLKKGKKSFTSNEQVHSLKLLHNHYLQWRFANAKAEASMHAQTRETEGKLYSLGLNMADLRDAVLRKRIEFELLQRTIALVTIAEAQMPYLDEWSALEEDYSNSLSGSIHALVNSSLRLPVNGNLHVDIKQLSDALHLALKTMDVIGAYVERFMPKAEEMDSSISELARVIGGERAILEECGDLLFKTYKSQVEDCSLRGHLMQLHRSNHCCSQPQQK